MKSIFFALVLLLFLTACAPAVTPQSPATTPTFEIKPTASSPTPTFPQITLQVATPSPQQNEIPAMLLPIRDEIAINYGISPDEIALISYDPVEWRDSCLGIQQAGMACMDVITPGYKVFFETPQGKVEVHTNKNASHFQVAASNSGIEGQAWVSPACPGPVKLGQECPDRPYQGSLWILDKDGGVLAEINTSPDGDFKVALPPGVYSITQPPGTALPSLVPQEVTVAPGEVIEIELILDSGMR